MSDGYKKAEVVLTLTKDLLIASKVDISKLYTLHAEIPFDNKKAADVNVCDHFERIALKLIDFLSTQYDSLAGINQSPEESQTPKK
ncbi:hypothetical protein MBAV_000827 [Candidatus Magnetobacterium bavaricum]|uniref:Uncharacterized protein n=1 Tax=Candidatus Magnetobacterium bavaricum TaxID=29290 RepID=A0A0F3GYR5_9BACT|nr:hypothetical protein MBAV_000827 [Candidatus Magnetobacterium bavaricum]